jgi:hypothetical protein
MTMLAGKLGGLAHQPGDHECQCRDEKQDLQPFNLVAAMQFEAEAEARALHIPKGFFDLHAKRIDLDDFLGELEALRQGGAEKPGLTLGLCVLAVMGRARGVS